METPEIRRIILILAIACIGTLTFSQVPSNPTVATAKVVNTFPYLDANVNTSLGGSNINTVGGCNAACCSTVVYRVEIPPIPGTLRGDINPFTPLAGSMLGYLPLVPNPTTDSDLQHDPGPGNFCGFRDSIQINNLSGGEVYYVLVFSTNNQTGQGGNTDVTFDFIPDCPAGYRCGSLDETVCDADTFITPSGRTLSTSGTYQDTLIGAAIGGLDSLIYINLSIEYHPYTEDHLADEMVCDTLTQPAYSELVSYASFHKADQDWVAVNGVVPSIAGTNRSVFMWMRQSTTVSGSSQQLFALNSSGGGNVCNLQIGTNEQLQVYDGGTSRNSGVIVTDGNWHFVGYTYDESNDSTKIYVDGVLASVFRNSQTVAANGQASLGQEFDSGNTASNFFEGEMTEVSVWNEVLDLAEINLTMQRTIHPTHPKYANLQGYYPMIVDCQAPLDTLIDFSPNGNIGTASATDIQNVDTLEAIFGFNSVGHFGIDWQLGNVSQSSSDTLLDAPAQAGNWKLFLSRDYFNISDDWVVSLDSGCGTACITTMGSISPVVCDSFVAPSGNPTYFSSGVYSDTLLNAMGCDSILTINLTINQSVTTTQNLTACDSAVINGTTYYSSQVVTDNFPAGAANGCDSTSITNLTINQSVTTTQSLTACDSATINGTTYTTSQVVTDVFPSGAANGCDSTSITNLTINQSVTTTQNLTACDSAMINGTTYYSSQVATDLFPAGAANGCDSTSITNLTINQSVTTTQSLTACDSATINGTTYTTSQVVTDVFPSGAANGCDSTSITNLMINQSVTTTQNLTACDSATINGTTYYSSQVVTDLFPAGAANGCDSTSITNLTINQSVTTTQNLTACDSAVINGTTYYSSQVVTDNFPSGSANGCDSTSITNLTINQSVTTTQGLTACDSAVINGTTYYSSQVVTDNFPSGSANGCDSTSITNLTINQSVTTTQNLTACDSAVLNGTTYYNSQIVTDLFPSGSANGCDSTSITNLTINQSVTTTQSLTACDSAVLNGTTYYNSQIVTDFFPSGSANGCDSTSITNLTINQSVTTTQSLTACDSAVINGTTYYSSQVVTDNFPSGAANGCDSTSITNLTINQSVTTTQSLTACDSAVINGTTYYSSQVVTDNFPSGAANGCDSTSITNLTINQSVTITQSVTLCDGDSITIGGNTYSSSGTYVDVFAGSNGCDSIITTNLTVHPPINTQVTVNQDTLWAVNANATYQWYTCVNGTPTTLIPGATDQFYVATANGEYAVELTENNCTVYSDCDEIILIGISGEALTRELLLYPNPNQGTFTLEIDPWEWGTKVEIYDQLGHLVYMNSLEAPVSRINLDEVVDGIYILRVSSSNGTISKKLILKR